MISGLLTCLKYSVLCNVMCGARPTMSEDCGIDEMLTYHLLNLGTNIQLVLLSSAFVLFFCGFLKWVDWKWFMSCREIFFLYKLFG